MWAKKTSGLDELQLIKRGNAFKHSFFVLVALSLVNVALKAFNIQWAKAGSDILTIVVFSLIVLIIEFVYHGIMPLCEKQQNVLIFLYGALGLFMFGVCVYDLIFENAGIVAAGQVTSSALVGFYGLLFIAVVVVYVIRRKTLSKEIGD